MRQLAQVLGAVSSEFDKAMIVAKLKGVRDRVGRAQGREDDFASPARSIRKPAKEKLRDRVLDDAELKLTWESADAEGGTAGALIKLLILSGARHNEMTELARDEIQVETIELPGERTKNGLPHTIPLTPMMRRVTERSFDDERRHTRATERMPR